MNGTLLVVMLVLCVLVLLQGFLVAGTLRALGLLNWRIEQLETVTPRHVGRDGLQIGRKAPDFTLPMAGGSEGSLHDFAGRKLLLVFTQSACGPCRAIIAELNRVQTKREHQVLIINNGGIDETHKWATEVSAQFPILAQDKFSVSKRYEVYATPFAFVIDERGVVTSKGIVGTRQYLNYVLSGAGNRQKHPNLEPGRDSMVERAAAVPISLKETSHV